MGGSRTKNLSSSCELWVKKFQLEFLYQVAVFVEEMDISHNVLSHLKSFLFEEICRKLQ